MTKTVLVYDLRFWFSCGCDVVIFTARLNMLLVIFRIFAVKCLVTSFISNFLTVCIVYVLLEIYLFVNRLISIVVAKVFV